MDQILILLGKAPEMIGYVVSALGALIALFLLIPGPQPEKFLQSCVDFLSRFSKK